MDENCRNDTSLSQNRTEYWSAYRVTWLMDGSGLWTGLYQSVQRLATGWTVRVSHHMVARFSALVQTGSGSQSGRGLVLSTHTI